MDRKYVWGLDIGGTKCALCAGNEKGVISHRREVRTADFPAWQDLLDALLRDYDAPAPAAVGISCGGPLDSARGLVLSPPNLPGWDEVPVTAWVTERVGAPAYLQNDANACALAEWQFGAGVGCRNMLFLTFGTGMGAGLILDGRLYVGTNDMAGEIGHVRMAPAGPVGYGKAGSFEGFCSGGGLAQLAQARMRRTLTAKQLAELAEAGDGAAQAVLAESGRYLGMGLSILIDLLNPERIVIGSIFARSGQWFVDEMTRTLEREALSRARAVCRIVPAALGEAIGDMAATTVAWNALREA